MADAREEIDWNHTAAIEATLANTVRDPRKKASPYTPADFHPVLLRRQRSEPLPLSDLKSFFPAEPG